MNLMEVIFLYSKKLAQYVALILLLPSIVFSQKIMTVEEAIEIAMSNSPQIRRSQYNLERSRELLNAQNAALKSKFALSITPFNFNRDRTFFSPLSLWQTSKTKQSTGTFSISQPIKWTDGTLYLINRFTWQDVMSEVPSLSTGLMRNTQRKDFINRLYLSFQQPLFTYNRTKLALRELELDLENTELQYTIQRLNLEQQVVRSFYEVYLAKLRVDIAKEELNNQQKSYQIIKNKVDAGLAAPEELYQAELNLATSKSSLQNEQVNLENLLDNFKNLIGLPLDEDISVIADVTYQPVKVDLQKAISHGLRNRMELRQRQIDIENARFNLIRTASQNEFKGNLTINYGIFGQDEQFRHLYDVPTRNEGFTISFDIPLYDWGEKESRIRASKAIIKSRELSLEEEKNNIIISIKQAYRSLQNLEFQVKIAEQNVKNAQLTYDINLERYKNGDLTSMDLNLFQTQLSEKKNQLVETLINYRLALLNLKIQSLWDFEKDRPVIDIKNSNFME